MKVVHRKGIIAKVLILMGILKVVAQILLKEMVFYLLQERIMIIQKTGPEVKQDLVQITIMVQAVM